MNREWTIVRRLTRRMPDGSRLDIEAGLTAGEGGYFAVTADRYEPGDLQVSSCGCQHESVIEVEPSLAPVVAVHLCDESGAPMHALSNAAYYLREKDWKRLAAHLRCTEERARKLDGMSNEQLQYELTWSFAPAWRADASNAKRALEALEDDQKAKPMEAACSALGIRAERIESEWDAKMQAFREKYKLRKGRRSMLVPFMRGSACSNVDVAEIVTCIINDKRIVEDESLSLSERDKRQIERLYMKLYALVGSQTDLERLESPEPFAD